MIITEYVLHRGKRKRVNELKPSSTHKVDVQCPDCKKTRTVHYRSIVAAGHHVCQACMMKHQAKTLTVGDRYGKVVVIGPSDRSGSSICLCDCGTTTEVINRNLINGITKSCGCLKQSNFDNANRPTGCDHGMWKGGVSTERERLASTKAYKTWREQVFDRDGYVCQCCKNPDAKINTHHIIAFEDDMGSRLDVENGATLCEDCHRRFHKTYGRKNISKENLVEFIASY